MIKKSNQIFDLLAKRFGQASCELDFNNNYQLIVAVVLSARCTDKRVNIVTKDLFKKYPTPLDLANANILEVEKIIYSCGFYKNKARSIINLAKDIVSKYDGNLPDTLDLLTNLSGVGRKTANVVLSVGFNKPAIAVDTHVFRLSNRLGLSKSKDVLNCEKDLMKNVQKGKWSQFHHYLVLFGRYVCFSQNPKCKECELKGFCDFYKNNKK
ncbi:MAG: endonuclease III [Clostridia bacterium]|nr:endonuclease III [Clostridia bacterium]